MTSNYSLKIKAKIELLVRYFEGKIKEWTDTSKIDDVF